MVESASILLAMYPDDFSCNDLLDHITDLLTRFMNRTLGDTIYRVVCDLYRKLGPDGGLLLLNSKTNNNASMQCIGWQ